MTYLPERGRAVMAAAPTRLVLAMLVLATLVPAGGARGQENPYRIQEGWAKLPAGRTWGSTSAVFPASDGRNIWVGERCGENICTGHDDLDPVLLFDPSGNMIRSFGRGLIVWPHGIFVDRDNNVWIADARAEGDKGNQILKFSPDGRLLMALGKAGVAGNGRDTFDQPSDVLVAPDGSIFVADGHGAGGNNRIVKFAADGNYLMEWGSTGSENGEFRDPHALAMDSQGRLFVGDRANSRIQIFDQQGKHLATWTQFGRPSGVFIDANDMMYVADSESNTARNGGWKRGIRIGSARDGWVTAFIPDPEPDPDHSGTSGAEGVAADAHGNVYGAEVGPRRLTRYIRR
jgi:DNA-binding beta-propeller fold protein YncE